MTIFDPFIVIIIDAIGTYSDGDYFRFYNYYYKKQGNGLVGIYLTIFLIFAFTVLNGFLFYNYMIFIHMNGRILDLYKRLSGSMKSFFIPHDNEVSLKYVQWVVERAKKKNYILKSTKQTVRDRMGKERNIQFIHISKIETEIFIIPGNKPDGGTELTFGARYQYFDHIEKEKQDLIEEMIENDGSSDDQIYDIFWSCRWSS